MLVIFGAVTRMSPFVNRAGQVVAITLVKGKKWLSTIKTNYSGVRSGIPQRKITYAVVVEVGRGLENMLKWRRVAKINAACADIDSAAFIELRKKLVEKEAAHVRPSTHQLARDRADLVLE